MTSSRVDPSSGTKSGFVLVIVIALLGVMAYLALQLAQTSQLSRHLSLNRLNRSKAMLSARSGLDKVVVGLRSGTHTASPQFQALMRQEGEDRNRNGALDAPDEDADGDGRLDSHMFIEKLLTPSMAMAEDPLAAVPRSLCEPVDGQLRGVTWLDDRVQPTVMATVMARQAVMDLNAGIESGKGPEGARYQQHKGTAYASNDPLHPFNVPLVELLNAWGNVLKHRHMVRTGKTYNWNVAIDHVDNLPNNNTPSSGEYWGGPFDLYDLFNPSGAPTMEDPLGKRIVESRPLNGYVDIGMALAIVEEYAKSWKDLNGNTAGSGSWVHRDGTTLIGPIDMEAIRAEFLALAATEIPRQDVVLMIPGVTNPGMMDPAPKYFDDEAFRQKSLNCRPYVLKSHIFPANAAPASLMAALIYGTKWPESWIYNIANVGQPLKHEREDYDAYFLENNWLDKSPAAALVNWYTVDRLNPPILSMTESLRLSAELYRGAPWADSLTLFNNIRSWPRGYDGKNIKGAGGGVIDGRKANDPTLNICFLDSSTDNRRERLLAHLVNPNVNMASLVYDDALPQPLENWHNSLGTSTLSAYGPKDAGGVPEMRGFNRRYFCDKSDATNQAGWLGLDHGDASIISLGVARGASGEKLAEVKLTTAVRAYQVLRIHHQSDWDKACRDPVTSVSTLGNLWTTYPESPGMPPATWDGHLALRPQLDFSQPAPWGQNLRARVPLTAFDPAHHPAEDVVSNQAVWPRGPRVLATTGGRHTNALRNSLKPAPGEPERSLLASGYHAIDTLSDLMPGGGYRVSPFHNSTGVANEPTPLAGGNDLYRKEAILSLRNALVDDSIDQQCPDPTQSPAPPNLLIPKLYEGALSFYFKPRFSYPINDASGTSQFHEGWTLFCMPFAVRDRETQIRCGSLPPYAATSELRMWYVGQIRLNWAPIPIPVRAFNQTPLDNWPYMAPFPGFNQIAYGPHYFPMMRGLNLGGNYGNILSRETRSNGLLVGAMLFNSSWNNSTAPLLNLQMGSFNAPPLENLILDFTVTKYASMDETNTNLNLLSGTTGFPAYHWNIWDADDDIGTLARACSYALGPANPLNLFDTSDPSHGEYHTVRKSFIINHPVNAANGRSLLSSRFHHQPMVAPGRWNHFFIAWRNMWNLLDNSVSGHRGGSLAVYLNGTFAQTLIHGANSTSMAALYTQSDYSEAYNSSSMFPNPLYWCPWEPGQQHVKYALPPYMFRNKVCHIPGPLNGLTGTIQEFNHIPFFGEFGGGGWPAISIHDLGFQKPNGGFRKVGFVSPYLFKSTPPRLYFGCQPVAPFNHQPLPQAQTHEHYLMPFGIPFGTFMDIQVFEAPAAQLLDPSGGFIPTLNPPLNSESIFPISAALSVYPLNLVASRPLPKVSAVRWSAHLPHFHRFWDDIYSTPGPDDLDSLQIAMSVNVGGSQVAQMAKSQDPLYPASSPSWISGTPVALQNPADLRLGIDFWIELGAANISSTPIIEDIDVTLLGPVEQGPIQMD